MLYQLIDQTVAKISKLNVKKETPIILQQIKKARPDFVEYLFSNAPKNISKDVLNLIVSSIASGILIDIKKIPSYVNELVSKLRDPSTDLALCCAIAGVLVYLINPRDLIPDDAPGGYGFLDDNLIIRAGLIEYLRVLPDSSKNIEDEKNKITFTARLIPLNTVQPLQQTINSMSMTIQLLNIIPPNLQEASLQQMINYPLQIPVLQQPGGFTPSPAPNIGTGHWSGGAYFEKGNVIIPGGPSMIDGQIFIPD